MPIDSNSLEQIVGGLTSALNAIEQVAAGNQIDTKSTLRTVREALLLAQALYLLKEENESLPGGSGEETQPTAPGSHCVPASCCAEWLRYQCNGAFSPPIPNRAKNKEGKMETLQRADGKRMKIKAECWQHDPYCVYMPVTARQLRRIEDFRSRSKPIKCEDGKSYPTNELPLRWGKYGAKVVARIAQSGKCPLC